MTPFAILVVLLFTRHSNCQDENQNFGRVDFYLYLKYLDNWDGLDVEGNRCIGTEDCEIRMQLCMFIAEKRAGFNDDWKKSCGIKQSFSADLGVHHLARNFSNHGAYYFRFRRSLINQASDNEYRSLFNPIRAQMIIDTVTTHNFVHLYVRLLHVYNDTETFEERSVEVDRVQESFALEDLTNDNPPIAQLAAGTEPGVKGQHGIPGVKTILQYSLHKRCALGYYGCRCNKFCMADISHVCNPDSGDKVCRVHWYPTQDTEPSENKRCNRMCKVTSEGMFCAETGRSHCEQGYCRQFQRRLPIYENPCIKKRCGTECFGFCNASPKGTCARHERPHCEAGKTCLDHDVPTAEGLFYSCG